MQSLAGAEPHLRGALPWEPHASHPALKDSSDGKHSGKKVAASGHAIGEGCGELEKVQPPVCDQLQVAMHIADRGLCTGLAVEDATVSPPLHRAAHGCSSELASTHPAPGRWGRYHRELPLHFHEAFPEPCVIFWKNC